MSTNVRGWVSKRASEWVSYVKILWGKQNWRWSETVIENPLLFSSISTFFFSCFSNSHHPRWSRLKGSWLCELHINDSRTGLYRILLPLIFLFFSPSRFHWLKRFLVGIEVLKYVHVYTIRSINDNQLIHSFKKSRFLFSFPLFALEAFI